MTQAVIRKPDEGRTVAGVGDVYRFLAMGEDTDGKVEPKYGIEIKLPGP